MRKFEFKNGYFYHVYNRGTDRRNIFENNYDYLRFLQSMREFNRTDPIGSLWEKSFQTESRFKEATWDLSSQLGTKIPSSVPLVRIISYAMLPNHFHFLLEQIEDNGIPRYMHKLGLGYTNYFNKKHKRSGSLFQGTYKATEALTDEYLAYISAYIHGNPEIHKISLAEKWMWSSYQDYLGQRDGTLCDKKEIFKMFKNNMEYWEFVKNSIVTSSGRKEELKELLFEE